MNISSYLHSPRRLFRAVFDRLGRMVIRIGKWFYRAPQEVVDDNVRRWYAHPDHAIRRFNYPLSPDSIVVDAGGYLGEWTAEIWKKYRCRIYVFEPVPDFAAAMTKQFIHHPEVQIFAAGLAGQNRTENIAMLANESSIYKPGSASQKIQLINAVDFFHSHNLKKIDLMKINIEGGEYELLEHLLTTGFIHHIHDLLIQFHVFVPDAEQRRKKIHRQLALTHQLTFEYPWIWENWRLKT